MRWDLDTIAAATGGVAVGHAVVTGVVADSRRVTPGVLFVALRGSRVDGHEFAAAAMTAGAAALLVEPGRLPDGCSGVEVADPAAGLLALGAARRNELTVPVVAITGSSGKTTTKDFTAAVLGPGAHAAPDSYNNEVGVPLTVLSCPDDATAMVLEVGSRGIGHIAALAALVRPDVAVVTNIGPAHMEYFGDIATTRRAKWELVEALAPGGTAVLPSDDADLTGRGHPRVLTFGEDTGADVFVSAVTLDAVGRPAFTIAHHGQQLPVSLTVAGRHQPRNAAAAVAAALVVGIPLETAVSRLAGAKVSRWRMEVAQRKVPGGTVTVVNDAYNANPASMEAALETVAALPGRHLAVLGMMHELGPAAPALHEAVGRFAADLGFVVIVVGDDPGIARGAGGSLAAAVADAGAAAATVRSLLHPGDVVLIKASRATGLESLAGMIGGGAAA